VLVGEGVFCVGVIVGDAVLNSVGCSSLLVVGEGVFFAEASTTRFVSVGVAGARPRKNPVIPPAIARKRQAAMIILRLFLLPSPPRVVLLSPSFESSSACWFVCILRFNAAFSAISRFIRSSSLVTASACRHSISMSGSVFAVASGSSDDELAFVFSVKEE